MSTPNIRNNVLHMYRNLIRLAKNVSPKVNSLKTLKMIRDAFRRTENSNLSTNEIENLLTKAQSNVSYLKMITPRTKLHSDAGEYKIINNCTTNNNNNSKSRVHSNWTGSNLDPDSVTRHNALLKRAGFMNNSHAKGGMF